MILYVHEPVFLRRQQVGPDQLSFVCMCVEIYKFLSHTFCMFSCVGYLVCVPCQVPVLHGTFPQALSLPMTSIRLTLN
jgi:hypothetical protein